MRYFLSAAKLLLLDLASSLVFLVLFLLTHDTVLSVSLGISFGVAQIGIQFVRGNRKMSRATAASWAHQGSPHGTVALQLK